MQKSARGKAQSSNELFHLVLLKLSFFAPQFSVCDFLLAAAVLPSRLLAVYVMIDDTLIVHDYVVFFLRSFLYHLKNVQIREMIFSLQALLGIQV